MENPNDIELRSEEVQEILGTPPSWLVSWGSSIAFFTFLAIGWASFFLKYPDTVESKIKVSASDPPRRMVTDELKYLDELLVHHEQVIEAGQALAVFRTDGEFGDVMILENYLITDLDEEQEVDRFLINLKIPSDLVLGDLQDDVFDFKEKQQLLRSELVNDDEDLSVRQIDRQIKQFRASVQSRKRQKSKLMQELQLARKAQTRNNNLYKSGKQGIEAVRASDAEVLAKERELSSINSEIKDDQLQIDLLKDNKSGVEKGSDEGIKIAQRQLEDSFKTLQRRVVEWKKANILSSPIPGIVLINDGVTDNIILSEGTEMMIILPTEKKETLGKINLNVKGSGKVAIHQKVIVKFDSYPFEEFGAFEGKVSRIGKIPTDGKLPIEVSFEKKLISTTGKQIEVTQEMTGEAIIITEEKRFVERIFEKLRSISTTS